MRFGHFFYPMKFDDSKDHEEIQNCLHEAELVESLGMDAIWFAEHYFTGECVYGDPLVFAGAIAVKTKTILLGFGILELPIHNPVRLAIQTSLLDNLSQGRLIVGTAKGSNYNAFEYLGFGSDPRDNNEQMEEAEDLLIKAWTNDNIDFQGKYWQVTFPSIRPRPYQKPHPPLARACIQNESIQEMARIGRPILLRGGSINIVKAKIELYRDTMASEGFSEQRIEENLDQIWVWQEMHLAETDDEALNDFIPVHYDAYQKMETIRQKWNPVNITMSTQTPPLSPAQYGETPNPDSSENLIGSPKRIAEHIELMQEAGIRNLMLTNRGLMSTEKTVASLKLLNQKVMPFFQNT